MKDWEIMLAEYLGGDFAQSITAEVGESVVKAIWLAGFNASELVGIDEIKAMSARVDAMAETLKEAKR